MFRFLLFCKSLNYSKYFFGFKKESYRNFIIFVAEKERFKYKFTLKLNNHEF